jgi:hypothetical protein
MKHTLILAAALALLTAGAAAGQQTNPTIESILRSGTAPLFTVQPVDDATIDRILQCGIRAPSARNSQPWHFTVVKNKEFLDRMKASMGTAAATRDPFFGGVTLIVIAGTKDAAYAPFDCGLACQDICLAAQSLGLGTHISVSAIQPFTTGKDAVEMRKSAGIPDTMVALAGVVIGYTDKQADAVSKASPRNDKGVITLIQ